MISLLQTNHIADAAINPYRIITHGTTGDGYVKQAAALADKLIGVSNELGADAAARVDIVRQGIAEVMYGGVVTRGDYLTTDANGKAVAANFVPGAVIYIIGIAEVSGVSGDIGKVQIAPGQLANEQQVVITDVTLTAAQVKALYTTPIDVLAAPGANKAIILLGVTAMLDFATTAFDGIADGEDLVLSYTNAAGAALAKFETTGFLDATADAVRYATPTQSGDTNLTPVANAKVVAHMLVGNIATGDSPVKLRIAYKVIDTVL